MAGVSNDQHSFSDDLKETRRSRVVFVAKVTVSNPWRIRIKELLPLWAKSGSFRNCETQRDTVTPDICDICDRFWGCDHQRVCQEILQRYQHPGAARSRGVWSRLDMSHVTVNGDLGSGLRPCCGADHYEAPAWDQRCPRRLHPTHPMHPMHPMHPTSLGRAPRKRANLILNVDGCIAVSQCDCDEWQSSVISDESVMFGLLRFSHGLRRIWQHSCLWGLLHRYASILRSFFQRGGSVCLVVVILCSELLLSIAGWCPPVISWFINPINYSYIMLYLP